MTIKRTSFVTYRESASFSLDVGEEIYVDIVLSGNQIFGYGGVAGKPRKLAPRA